MDKRTQIDVWDLAYKLSQGIIPLDSPVVTQTNNLIIERFPEIEETKEWERLLLVTRNYPGIEANSLCEKAKVQLTTLIHLEEVDVNQLLLRVTRRGVARFYNIGDWGIFWLVIKDHEANQEKIGEKLSTDSDRGVANRGRGEGLKVNLEKKITNVEEEFWLRNNKRIFNRITEKSPLIDSLKDRDIVGEESGFNESSYNKEIESGEYKKKSLNLLTRP